MRKFHGEISFEELIDKIKIINNKIKIIFILENNNLEKMLINKNIKNIFYNNQINFNEFILKLKNINFSEEELLKREIKKLNKIILEKNNELNKYKNGLIKSDLLPSENIKLKNKIFNKNKLLIISQIGVENLKIIKDNLKNNLNDNYKIEYSNNLNKIKYYKKIIFILNSNLEEIKILKNKINLVQEKYSLENKKIKILFINDKIDIYLLKIIFKNFTVLGVINKKNFLINKKIINKIERK